MTGATVPRQDAPCSAAVVDGPRLPRILIVDDDPDTADTQALVLALWGYEVRVARSGPEALELAAAYQPEVALVDLVLPGMDGYHVARRLRGHPALRSLVLIALTGLGGAEYEQRSEEAGFDRHLLKPVDPAALHELIASATQGG